MANDAKFQDPSASWYMVPWVGKRRKTQLSQASKSEDNPIDKLPDELMVEVLCRLPNSKFVIQCKCVCKHWDALVSLPDFVRCFINHKSKSKSNRAGFVCMEMEEEEEEQLVAILMQFKKQLLLRWRHPIFNFKGFSFNSLPSFIPKETPIVVGAFNDLLLYYVKDYFMMHPLFLCNVQTRQWLPLPMIVILSERNHFGFLCEPYYSLAKEKEKENSTMPNALYRYSIAILARKGGYNEAFTEFDVQIFSSETGRWSESVLSLPRPSRLDNRKTIGFGFNGRQHIRGLDYIIAFDPYNGRNDENGVIKCHLIKWPTNVAITHASVVIWQGCLQVSRLVPYGEGEERLDIWFLKDYHTGQWSLQHSVLIQDLIERSRFDLWAVAISKSVMGVHPCHPHILYVLFDDRIVLCNVRRRRLEIICRIPKDSFRAFHINTVLWVTLPLWPSPLCSPLQ